MPGCSRSDPCRAEVIHRAAVAAQSIQVCPGLSVVACRLHGMKQRPPPDAGSGTVPGTAPVDASVAAHPPVRDDVPSAAVPSAPPRDAALTDVALLDAALLDAAPPDAAPP